MILSLPRPLPLGSSIAQRLFRRAAPPACCPFPAGRAFAALGPCALIRPGTAPWSHSDPRRPPAFGTTPPTLCTAARPIAAMASGVAELATTEWVLAHNDQIVPCEFSSGDWLSAAPRGAYTTARTYNQTMVFEFDFHVARLAESARLMMEGAPGEPTRPEITDEESIRPRLVASLSAAVSEFHRLRGGVEADGDAELKLTVLMTWDEGRSDIFSHVCLLPQRPKPPVKVLIRGAPRHNAAAKDSQWVRDRKSLEKDKPADVNEIVLASEEGELFEGMSSNFMAIRGGAVYTADEGILKGTVRDVLLKVCKAEGVPVVLEAPNIRDFASWEGVFVASTSRLLLPVHDIAAPDLPEPLARTFSYEGTLGERLERLVMGAIEANSERIL